MDRKRLMIVDDSVFIYEEMRRMLEGSSYEIIGYAKSGEEAITMYESLQPDMLTLDIILPGMDGLDTARVIMDRWPEANIIIVSSLAYDDTQEHAEALGAKGFVFKPFSKEDLLVSLNKTLE